MEPVMKDTESVMCCVREDGEGHEQNCSPTFVVAYFVITKYTLRLL